MNYPWMEDYFLDKKGVVKEYKAEWETFRYIVKDKMIGLYSTDSEGRYVITIKCSPEFGAVLRDGYKDIRPGYHMNKVHWNSVDLNGEVPAEILKQMIDNSYELIFDSMSKKMQKEIMDD